MARVNVEDGFYCDPRFLRLCAAVGDAAKAIGLCVLAWRLAQKFWSAGESLVPIDEFSDGGFMPLLEVGLARREGDCIYVRGTKDQTAWLIQKRAAGKMGGKAKAAKRKLADASGCLADPSGCLAGSSEAYPLTLTLTPSLKENKKEDKYTFESKPSKAPPSEFDLSLAEEWATYSRQVSKTAKPDIPKWANTVRQLRELDGFAEPDLRLMLKHAQDDTFWRTNVASLPALRTRSKNGLLKAENLLTAAKEANREEGSGIDWDAIGRDA